MHKALFSFPRGTVGIGLLLARVLSALGLSVQAAVALRLAAFAPLPLLGASICFAGILQLLGLWTRAVSALIGVGSGIFLLFHLAPWWHGTALGALNITLTALGPGAWSLDARRSRWKRIEIPKR